MKKYLFFLAIGLTGITTAQGIMDPERVANSWAVKFSPTQLLAGEINFGYEQKIGRLTTLDFEVGPTLSSYSLFGLDDVHFGGLNSGGESRTGVGALFAAGVRYYPIESIGAMRGLYISPQFKYRNRNLNVVDNTGMGMPDQQVSSNQFLFRFLTGVQVWAAPSFAFDIYFGMGLGYRSVENAYPVSIYNPDTGLIYGTWEVTRDKGAMLNATLGFKVAIGD